MAVKMRQKLAGSGVKFGKYVLVEQIAKGGMAEIFLAQYDGMQGFRKTCVIKKILPERAREREFTRMFSTEARVSAKLSHPHIVQTFDFGRIGADYFLAMEYVDGPTLRDFLQRGLVEREPMEPRHLSALAIPVLDALHAAHTFKDDDGTALNIVHRDVTPGNILFTKQGVPKLADFGVVKISNNPDVTGTGVIKGKFSYVSPEAIASKPIDRRSDVFSLGVVLWELAVGQRLFKRADLASELMAVTECKIPRPSELVPNFPRGFEVIILRALAKRPEQRYQNAEEMLEAVEAYRRSAGFASPRSDLKNLVEGFDFEAYTLVSSEMMTRRRTDSVNLHHTGPVDASVVGHFDEQDPFGGELIDLSPADADDVLEVLLDTPEPQLFDATEIKNKNEVLTKQLDELRASVDGAAPNNELAQSISELSQLIRVSQMTSQARPEDEKREEELRESQRMAAEMRSAMIATFVCLGATLAFWAWIIVGGGPQ